MQKLFEDEPKDESPSYTLENLEEYFRTKSAYEQEIRDARESMRDALKHIVNKYKLPKTEIAIAEQIRKKEADLELINEILDGLDTED
mgnify:CR=1 FL=1|tara:strand:- start:310 stop:573 length:264 start_codon:yes stop_codon:yes gene_type:complete